MVRAEILEENPVGVMDLKDELKKIKKRDGELTTRSQKLEDYINHFKQLSKKDYKELISEIEALDVPRLKPVHILKIADIVPANIEELKCVLQGYTLTVTNKNMKRIVSVTSKYCS